MRSLFSILLCAITVSAGVSQTEYLTVANNDDSLVLAALFNAKVIMNPDDSSLVAIWKPNFAEAQEFNISYDSMCHTVIEEVLDYRSSGKRYSLIVFATYEYVDSTFSTIDCHACAPDISVALFSTINDSAWEFERMKKHLTRFGAWGKFQGADLQKIGDNAYALELTGENGGQGVWEESIILYELDSFGEIFFCKTHEDNSGSGDKNMYDWDKKLRFVPGKNTYNDIILTKKGRGHNPTDNYDSPIVKLTGKNRYKFSEEENKYILVK